MRAAVLVILLCPSACATSTTFGTARTVAEGDMSHTIGASAIMVKRRGDYQPVPLPVVSYGLRSGLSERVDIGAQASLPNVRISADVKYNAVRTKYVDLAVAPCISAAAFAGSDELDAVLGADVAVIANLNFGSVSLVPFAAPGVVYTPVGGDAAPIIRTGVGAQFRLDGWTIEPQFATAVDPRSAAISEMAFGIGFGLGDQPVF